MTHIFISYSRDDLDNEDGTLQRLITQLQINFSVWFDKKDIVPGTNWKQALDAAVKNSQVVVFFMSPQSVKSQFCEAELDTARNNNITVIPYIYEDTNFPFGLSQKHAIFHHKDSNPAKRLEEALREIAPETYIHGESLIVTQGDLHTRKKTFAEIAATIPQALEFIATVDNQDISLIGLPLANTSFCTGFLFGRADDDLGWTGIVQLGLQFSGEYRSSRFPVQIAQHFLKKNEGVDFPLRLIIIYGPPRLTFDSRSDAYSLSHTLEIPDDNQNQWADAVTSVQKMLRVYSEGRGELSLQMFAQGPVAGILYELGAKFRNLQYKAEHYHFDRDSRDYYRVLGKI